jgi:hypothetical protein
MAAIERPAPAERIAVFVTREFPGRESRIDWAFLLGSSVGTLETDRIVVRLEAIAGTLRETAGRRRAAPGLGQEREFN